MSRMKKGYWKWATCIVIFVTFIVLCLIRTQNGFIYDSQYYWVIADSVFENGDFNIFNFPETFRGYFFPVLLGAVKHIGFLLGNEYICWYILSGILVSTLITLFLPSLVLNKSIENMSQAIRIVLFFLIIYIIWGDLFYYPLSDMPAFYFLCIGVILLRKMLEPNIKIEMIIIKGIACGVSLYIAYNIRAAFLYGVLMTVIIYIVSQRKNIKKLLSVLCSIFVGVLIISLPQMMINHKYVGSYSPKVYTEQYNNYARGLELQQVYWGLTSPRYESYAGDEEFYSSPGVYFDDPVGEEILRRDNISVDNFGIKDVFKLILKYPLDMVGIYTRHLVSLLTPLYKEAYIHNIYSEKGVLIIVNIIIWILAGISLFVTMKQKKLNLSCVWLIPFFIPCLLQLFGAPELRFFMPIHFIVYFYVFVVIGYRKLYSKIKEHLIPILVCSVVIALLWICVIGDILSFNREKTLLIHDDGDIYKVEKSISDDKFN